MEEDREKEDVKQDANGLARQKGEEDEEDTTVFLTATIAMSRVAEETSTDPG